MLLPDLPTPAPSLPTNTNDDFIIDVGTPNSPADSSISSDTYMSSEEKIKTNVASGLGNNDQASLKKRGIGSRICGQKENGSLAADGKLRLGLLNNLLLLKI